MTLAPIKEWKCDQCGRKLEPIPEVKKEKCFVVCEDCYKMMKEKPGKFTLIELAR